MSHEQWLAMRRSGIGGSDAAAILGLNPYKTAVDVWLEKTGKAGVEADNEVMWFGRNVEPIIAQRFEQETGYKVRMDNKIRYHGEYDFVLANLDRTIVAHNGRGPGVLEIKSTNKFYREQWELAIPEMWYLQVQHYMLVTGYEWGYVAYLVDRSYEQQPVEADKDLHEQMIQRYTDFWHSHVLTGTPPQAATANDMISLFPEHKPGKSVEAPGYIITEAEELVGLKAEMKLLKEQIGQAELSIKAEMADAEILTGPEGKPIATWKTAESNKIDSKRLKSEKPDIAEQYSFLATSRRFNLKLK